MEEDERIFIYGIGVPDHKKVFGTTAGLDELFPGRSFDTPLSESALTGFGTGSALLGLHPLLVHIRMDFALLTLNQLYNITSTNHYMSGRPVPLTIRGIVGRGWGQGCHHSKSLHSIFSSIPGLKVYLPVTPAEAKGMTMRALRDPNPTFIIEHRWLYWAQDYVPGGPYETPISNPVIRHGSDITVASTSWMTVEAIRAAEVMAERDISVEVVNLRYLNPLPIVDLFCSVKNTGKLIVADNDYRTYGISGEIFYRVHSSGLNNISFSRVGWPPQPIPTARHMEDRFYPNAASIVFEIESQLGLSHIDTSDMFDYSHEEKFKGPF